MLIGSGAKGLQLTLAGFQYINTFNYEGKEITLSPTVMDALSTLVSSKSREVFDAQLTQLLDTQQISQEEYTLAQKLANEVANFDHQIEAEKESLKQQLMNGSDIDLQAEYAAYQEVFAQLEAIKEQYSLGTAETEYILNPSGPNLQLDITISNETELDTWMRELKEAMDFIEGVAEFRNVNLEEKLNENVTFEESSLDKLKGAGNIVSELTEKSKNHIKYGDVTIKIKNSQTGEVISEITRKVSDPPISVPTFGVNVQYNVSGIHFGDILSPNLVEEISGRTLVTTLQDGTPVFESEVRVWVQEANNGAGQWKNLGLKTWWPDSWSEQKIWNSISEAFSNKTLQYNNLYHGTTSDGTKIAIRLDGSGNISTAYIIP